MLLTIKNVLFAFKRCYDDKHYFILGWDISYLIIENNGLSTDLMMYIYLILVNTVFNFKFDVMVSQSMFYFQVRCFMRILVL